LIKSVNYLTCDFAVTRCGALNLPPNMMTLNTTRDLVYYVNDTVLAVCQEGYEMHLAAINITCVDSEVWSLPVSAHCTGRINVIFYICVFSVLFPLFPSAFFHFCCSDISMAILAGRVAKNFLSRRNINI